MAAPVPLRDDFDAAALRMLARKTRDASQARRLLALAEVYDGGSRQGGADWRGWTSDRPRLGAAVQHGRCDRSGRRQGARTDAEAQRRRATDASPDRRGRSDPGGPWRRTLAPGRSGAMGLGGVPGFDLEANAAPGAARDGLPQAVGPAAASRQGRGGRHGI